MYKFIDCIVAVVLLLSVVSTAEAHEWGTTIRVYPDTLVGVIDFFKNVTTDGFTLRTGWTTDAAGVKCWHEDEFIMDGGGDKKSIYDLNGQEVVIRGVVTETVNHQRERSLTIKIQSIRLKDPRADQTRIAEKRQNKTDEVVSKILSIAGQIRVVEGYVEVYIHDNGVRRLYVYADSLSAESLLGCEVRSQTTLEGESLKEFIVDDKKPKSEERDRIIRAGKRRVYVRFFENQEYIANVLRIMHLK